MLINLALLSWFALLSAARAQEDNDDAAVAKPLADDQGRLGGGDTVNTDATFEDFSKTTTPDDRGKVGDVGVNGAGEVTSSSSSSSSSKSKPRFSEAELIRLSSKLLMQTVQGVMFAAVYENDCSSLYAIDSQSGECQLVQTFAKFQRVSSLFTRGDELYAFVNDVTSASALEDLNAPTEWVDDSHVGSSDATNKKRGGVYARHPPYLVHIPGAGRPWVRLCGPVLRHAGVGVDSRRDLVQPHVLGDAAIGRHGEVYVYDPRQKLVAVVNAKTCAMTDLGSPRGDDDLQDNGFAIWLPIGDALLIPHIVPYFSHFQRVFSLDDVTFLRNETSVVRVTTPSYTTLNDQLVTALDVDHVTGRLFALLSEVDEAEKRVATRLVQIDALTGVATVLVDKLPKPFNAFALALSRDVVTLDDLLSLFSDSSTSSTTTTPDADAHHGRVQSPKPSAANKQR